MELQRGVCSLCLENGRVLLPPDAEHFVEFLPRILPANFLTEAEFQKIKDSIKICVVCSYKVEAVSEIKILKNSEKDISGVEKELCNFCRDDKYVIKVKDDWKYFVLRTEGFLNLTDFPVCVCPRCVFYFDTVFNIKTKLSLKFPQLATHAKSGRVSSKQNDTPKRKSLSKSPPSSKKRKIFNNCFSYLQPLCNNNYHIDDDLKRDSRLYKKIAYVNLKNVKDANVNETPKVRPVIKIKLKQRSNRKGEKLSAKVMNELNEYMLDNSFKTQPYVRLCKSEEAPNKNGTQKSRKRRHSCNKDESLEEQTNSLEETPKAASDSTILKRRVSLLYSEPEEAKSEEKSDTQITSDEICKIDDKYANDSTTNDNEQSDQLENTEDSQVETNIEENGVEKETDEGNVDKETEQSENIENGACEDHNEEESEDHNEEESEDHNEEESEDHNVEESEEKVEENLEPLSPETSDKTTTKEDGSGNGGDSDSSDKLENQSNVDNTDSVNGSERKKKRVTFSDEIN